MDFKQYGILRNGIARTVLLLLTSLFAAMVPTAAQAAGGEDVVLRFSSSDYTYLVISLVFGLIAIAFAFIIGRGVLAQSPGNEKMQEVGAAIKAGALAYLKRQVKTMGVFVAILAIGLAVLFSGKFGWNVAVLTGVCFVLGVAASYIAGYSGMIMAVNGNTRVANAALASPKRALETAFRSGAVAGLVTVGMGLLGATAIFMLFPSDAMKLLVGFGFGGSLAALFMRVGGGIYTKAADVGADLVGKVEAGIPEDDP
ncbi:MAG: sodium/proton-translocating pyrophosphatase, partial [Fimbriimonadaceae bacterium]